MEFIDTHCHIHFKDYGIDPDLVIDGARNAGVNKLVCVGCDLDSSVLAIEFVQNRPNCWASIGIHPHEAKSYQLEPKLLEDFAMLASGLKVIAIGECGLDYYYMNSPITAQKEVFRYQIELAITHDLPLIFHVRDAFDDFWAIISEYKGETIKGVVHSFSDTLGNMKKAIENRFYIGLNGIVTFSSKREQIEAFEQVPLDRLLIETDAPYLTPVPYRGNICKPEHVVTTAKILANLKGVELEDIAQATTRNAERLFGI